MKDYPLHRIIFIWSWERSIIFDFAMLQAYSMLPKISSFKTLPAIRMLKISPKPWSKINSADVLEINTTKNGCKRKLSLRSLVTCLSKFLSVLRLFTKRDYLLPLRTPGLFEVLFCPGMLWCVPTFILVR